VTRLDLIRELRAHGSPGTLHWSQPAWRYAWSVWRHPDRYRALLEWLTSGSHRRLGESRTVRRCLSCQAACFPPVAHMCGCCQRVLTTTDHPDDERNS